MKVYIDDMRQGVSDKDIYLLRSTSTLISS